MILPLKNAEIYSPIKEKTAELQDDPYFEIERVEILKYMNSKEF
jgi:hypothetical protein